MDIERTPASIRVDVGTCALCTDALYLIRDENGVRVECICGKSDIPAVFFDTTRGTTGWASPACSCVSLERVNPGCLLHGQP